MRSLLLLLLLPLLSAATILPTSLAERKALVGGWTPIKDLSDPHIREIAEFAVAEHNRQADGHRLTLGRVVKGESQVVAGVNYRLTLVATGGGGAAAEYEAVVWEQAWRNFRQLTSFKPVRG